MFLISFFDWRGFFTNSYLILFLYFLSLIFLAGLFLFAPEIRGTKSWYQIGSFSFNPLEFTQIILILLLAKYFSTRHAQMYQIKHIIFSGFYVFLPTILIFFQPNLGACFILISLWVAILIIAGIKLRHFLLLCLFFLIIFGLSWQFLLKDYQKSRIISFLKPQLEPLGIGWSQNQAKIAIGSGGFFGQGWKKGSQTRYGFLPEPQTDFIFAAIAEEFGFLGVGVLLGLFLFLLFKIIKIALNSQTNFPRLFASGFVVLLFTQIFIHIGMNLGILPIIGISLPLVSYGGSGLFAIFLGFGIIQSIKAH